MRRRQILFTMGLVAIAVGTWGCGTATSTPVSAAPSTAGAMDRTVLPILEPSYPPITELDARNAKAPPRFEVKAPEGAPNVLIVLIDDMGFGMPSTFGGPIHMPTADKAGDGEVTARLDPIPRGHRAALVDRWRII